MNRYTTDNTLLNDAYWKVNKFILKIANAAGEDGWHCAGLLDDLIQQERFIRQADKLEDGFFYLEQSKIEERTGLSPHNQRKVLHFLTKIDVLTVYRKGTPPRNWYRINHENLWQVLSQSVADMQQKLKFLTYIDENREPLLNKEKINKEKSIGPAIAERLTDRVTEKKKYALLPETEQIIEYWNALCEMPALCIKPTKHSISSPVSKTVKKIDSYVRALLRGNVATAMPQLSAKYAAAEKIAPAWFLKKWSVDEIKEVLKTYALHFLPDYWPYDIEGKRRLPRGLDVVLYNGRAPMRKSYFFVSANGGPQRAGDGGVCVYPDTVDYIVQRIQTLPGVGVIDTNAVHVIVKALAYSYEQYIRSGIELCNLRFHEYAGTFKIFVSRFLGYVESLFDSEYSGLDFHLGMLHPTGKTFARYVKYCEECGFYFSPGTLRYRLIATAVKEYREIVDRMGVAAAEKKYGNRKYISHVREQELKEKAKSEGLRGNAWVTLL